MARLSLAQRGRQRPLALLLTFLLTAGWLFGLPVASPAPAAADSPTPLSITMTSSANPVASGAQLTYTITVANTGGASVDSVKLEDQINGLTGLILTSTVGSCSQSFNQVSCSAGTLEGGQSWMVTIRGVVTASNGTTLQNGATVTGTKSSQTFTNSTSIATLVGNPGGGGLADLIIAITAPASAVPSGDVTYKLTVNNTGSVNATDIRVVFTLPQGFALSSANCTSLFKGPGCGSAVPGGTGISLDYDGGAVNAGANATLTIVAKASANAGEVTATTVVDPLDAIAESNNLNNTADATTTVGTPVPQGGTLTILKTFQSNLTQPGRENEATPGAVITYTLVVKNTAATRADSISVVDTTQGLDAASITATTTKGACTVAAPKVTCTQTSPTLRLDPGETLTVVIRGTVVATAGSLIINTATVNGNIKNKGHSNTSTATTIVKPRIDLTITQSTSNGDPAHPLPVRAADKLVYDLVVGNSGVFDATGVVVRQPLPADTLLWKPGQPGGLFNVTVPPGSGFGCAIDAARVVTCTGGTVPAESIARITFTVIAPQRIGPITTTATVDPNNTIPESDEANNTFAVTTAIATGIDLTPTQKVNFSPVAPSGTLVYQLTVTNIGTQDTTGVVVRDTLPAGTRFRSARDDLAPNFGGPNGALSRNFTCVHDGSAFGGVVECTGGIIAGTYATSSDLSFPQADFATITITLFAPAAPGLINNQVRVDPTNAIPEIREDNNINTLTTDVQIYSTDPSLPPLTPSGGVFNELHITSLTSKPANGNTGDPVAPSGTLIYTIELENTGSDPAFNVRVRDTLAAGSIFVKAESSPLLPGNGGGGGFRCTESGGVVECMGGSLAGTGNPGAKATLTITIFAPAQPATITNEAIIDPENAIPEADETNNRATTTTVVKLGGGGGFIELNILNGDIDDSPDPVATSGVLQYVITARNTGTDIAFNVKLRDTLPAGATFISAVGDPLAGPADAPSGGFQCTAASGVVDCSGGTIAAGSFTKVTIKVFAPTQPGLYTNQAIIDPDNDIPEADETNNRATCVTTVTVGGGGQFFDLEIVSLADTPDPIKPRGEITYAIEVRNNGSDQAFNVAVRDVLPAGVTFVSAIGSNDFLCAQANGVVNCTGGNLLGGGTATITIVVEAPNKHNVTLTNQARVDPDNTTPEANETNNSKTTTTVVKSRVNLQITKSGPPQAEQNSTQTYTLTVSNPDVEGGVQSEPAFGVRVVDPLPVGLIVLGVNTKDPGTNNFACQVEQNPVNVVQCVGDLDGTANALTTLTNQVVIEIEVFVAANSGTKLDNEGCVDPANTIVESVETDNCSTASTTVGTVDLTIEKSDALDPIAPGQTQTYTLIVSNIGTLPAGAVTVTDTLPTGMTVAGQPAATNGFVCSGTTVVTCNGTLAGGDTTVITIEVVIPAGTTGPIENRAQVSSAADPAPADCATSPTNNCAVEETAIGAATVDLVLVSVTESSDPVSPGETLVYSVVASNQGSAPANNAKVRVTVPTTGVTFVDAAGTDGFLCGDPSAAGVLDCSGNFDPGATITITVTLTVTAGAPSALTLTATADPDDAVQGETLETNNTLEETTTVASLPCSGSCVELVMSLLDSPDPVASAGTITYKATVGNAGNTDATAATGKEVLVWVTLPVTFPSATVTVAVTGGGPANPFTCGAAAAGAPAPANTLACRGDLLAGEGAIITITVQAPAGPTTVSATAVVDPLATIAEPNDANNTADATTSVKAP